MEENNSAYFLPGQRDIIKPLLPSVRLDRCMCVEADLEKS